jgi:hypothetical protein
MVNKSKNAVWRNSVLVLSLLLMFVAIPHTLEDFTLGEPAKHNVPVAVLAGVVAGLFVIQGLGLFFLGNNKKTGYFIHLGLGLLWPLAAGSAQLPVILTTQPYRSGFVSLFYVFGMIVLGLLLLLASILGLRSVSFPEK